MMLNTQSRSTALLVWIAIAAICVTSIWSVLSLGPPVALARAIQDSEAAAAVTRNQVLFTGLVGFAGLAFAYLLNGWRERAEQRHAIERGEKRLASVLAREATELSDALLAMAGAPVSGGARTRLAELVQCNDSALMELPSLELARLGPGASGAVQGVRRKVRQLASVAGGRDEGAARALTPGVLETALAARNAAQVLALMSSSGTSAADKVRIVPPSEAEVAELARRLADATGQPRLLPAA